MHSLSGIKKLNAGKAKAQGTPDPGARKDVLARLGVAVRKPVAAYTKW